MLHLKLLEKQEHAKPKSSRREIIKIKVKIYEIETKKPYKESMTLKAGSLEKVYKIDRSLANLNKMRKEKTPNQLNQR
jgi:hypothetical protein